MDQLTSTDEFEWGQSYDFQKSTHFMLCSLILADSGGKAGLLCLRDPVQCIRGKKVVNRYFIKISMQTLVIFIEFSVSRA